MSKAFVSILLGITILMSSIGCSSIGGYTIAKREAIEKQIVVARAEVETKMASLKEQEEKLLREVIAKHVAREQAAADYLFKGSVVYSSLKLTDISRPTMVMGQSIQQTASQLPAATPEAQAIAFKALQSELDEVKTSTEALKLQYETELGKARQEGEIKAKTLVELKTKVEQVEKERTEVLTKARTVERDLQAEKDKIQDKEIAVARQSEADAKRSERIKMWLIGILLVAAAACGVGAAFLPIPQIKSKLIVGAAVCGGAAIALPFIEPWMVMVAVVGLMLLVAAWAIKNYKEEHTDALDTYRAINEIKQKKPEVFKETIAPTLKEWHTDESTRLRIDSKLKQIGDT